MHQFWPNFDNFAVQIDLNLKKRRLYRAFDVDIYTKTNTFLTHNDLGFILNPIMRLDGYFL